MPRKELVMDTVKDYVAIINAPWGKMLYDLLFLQLKIPQTPKLAILDFGSGFGVAANHFAAWHDVTAIEPNTEMIENGCKENPYVQIHGSVEALTAFADNNFDVVFCHNVLEYIEDKRPIITELLRVLKPGGTLSVVKHNRVGRVFHNAVFWNDPKKALLLLDPHANDRNNYLGTQYLYSNEDMVEWVKPYGGVLRKVLGMRTFWALGQDNAVKYDDDWYQYMLALESRVADLDEYKNAAYLNHLLIEKAGAGIES